MYDSCPDCDGQVNDFGFCEDCGLDYEDFLSETEKDWPKSWGGALLRAAKKGKKNESSAGDGSSKDSTKGSEGGEPDGWLDIYRENQQP